MWQSCPCKLCSFLSYFFLLYFFLNPLVWFQSRTFRSQKSCHEHLIQFVEFIIARWLHIKLLKNALDGGGVRNEKADTQEHRIKAEDVRIEEPADGLSIGKNSTECQDYTKRAIYTRRPKYNGTLLPERYIADELQTKTGIWLETGQCHVSSSLEGN